MLDLAQALGERGSPPGRRWRLLGKIVEAWIPSQRVASYRKTVEAVAAVLRAAEGRR